MLKIEALETRRCGIIKVLEKNICWFILRGSKGLLALNLLKKPESALAQGGQSGGQYVIERLGHLYSMKFAIINDIHIGDYQLYKGVYRKVTPYAETLLKNFVRRMNRSFLPDFVVQGGDLIEDVNHQKDIQNYKKGLAILSKLKCPVYHVVGNHELRNLTIKELKGLLGYSRLFFKIDHKSFRLIFLFPRKFYPEREIKLSDSQLSWFKSVLHTKKKVIIFSHHSLIPINTRGNFWFDSDPRATFIKNHHQFIGLISKQKVVLVFNGHLHWNRKTTRKGIPFITIQSLVENISNRIKGPPTNAFALITIDKRYAHIRTEGRDGVRYRVKI